jgi:hypothetical protein
MTLVFLIFLLSTKLIGQTIKSGILFDSKLHFDSIIKFTRPSELFYIDTIAAIKLAYMEFNNGFLKYDNNKKELFYPYYSFGIAEKVMDKKLGNLLLDYFKFLPKAYKIGDTLVSIYGHGWYDNLIVSLISQHPDSLEFFLEQAFFDWDKIAANKKADFPKGIRKTWQYIAYGKPSTIKDYEDAKYCQLQIACALQYLNAVGFSNYEIEKLRNQQVKYRQDYKFSPTTYLSSSLDSLNSFKEHVLTLSREFNSINELLESDKNILNEVLKDEEPISENRYFQRPIVTNKNMALIWDKLSYKGHGNGTLYKITMINNKTIKLKVLSIHL